jgi:hypothetical protein
MTDGTEQPRTQCAVCRAVVSSVLMPFHRAWHGADAEMVDGSGGAQPQEADSRRV